MVGQAESRRRVGLPGGVGVDEEYALSLGTRRWTLSGDQDSVTIGRASNADVRLNSDDQVSRIHARLTRTGAGWTITDESRNGTALNGRRLTVPAAPLSDQDRIQIGRSVITFHEPAAGQEPTSPADEATVVTPAAPAVPDEPPVAPVPVVGIPVAPEDPAVVEPDVAEMPVARPDPMSEPAAADSPFAPEQPDASFAPEEPVASPFAPDEPASPFAPAASPFGSGEADAPGNIRRPAGAESTGHVRIVRVLAVAGIIEVVGLIANVIGTFAADQPGGALRWLIPTIIALIAAMVVAILDAAKELPPSTGLLGRTVPAIAAIVAVLVIAGIGGFALTAGVRYTAGYVTGKEPGVDRLVRPVARTTADVTITVENVTYTSHFTRVAFTVNNAGSESLSLPTSGSALVGPDGAKLKADGSRSQWDGTIPAGALRGGTLTFKDHFPADVTAAALTLTTGDATFAVNGLTLTN